MIEVSDDSLLFYQTFIKLLGSHFSAILISTSSVTLSISSVHTKISKATISSISTLILHQTFFSTIFIFLIFEGQLRTVLESKHRPQLDCWEKQRTILGFIALNMNLCLSVTMTLVLCFWLATETKLMAFNRKKSLKQTVYRNVSIDSRAKMLDKYPQLLGNAKW